MVHKSKPTPLYHNSRARHSIKTSRAISSKFVIVLDISEALADKLLDIIIDTMNSP